MTKVVDLYFKLLKLLIVLCMVAMIVLVFGNVVLRYAFNSGISVSEELSRWFFVWMIFLGALVALKDRAHLGLDSLVKRLPPAGKRLCLVIGHLMMLYICWLIFSGSWQQAVINLDVVAPASGMSMAVFYAAGLVFGASAAAILVYELYLALFGKLRDDEMVMVKDNDAAEVIAHNPIKSTRP
ncbi:TRAP transporter small permease [Pseudomonas sp. Fig-3]|jgi:TRAP-type C4-dicarboxylate transport system permease small subunit|uniref:TRAP transporter small permease protein n=1 Tax=Pseudomonas rhizophila TaxID=2045200 RepID=A0ABN5JRM4_9PSED|nr:MULTISPECIES: TRAP transporter small permease [Pseudomonas]AVU74738.1 TRAP transporter small permease [Pseudomonas rhizophila]MBD0704026.1 TRAP transporter small permease [Pseudomonas sp. PSB1]MDD2033066.1 TRAP transporter small permease [Pseudomonas sp. 39167]MDR8386359.1 TRAP transporter small permease [Pseudomonas sp. JL2]MEA1030522.1 TRAP transporter small permease [Pseudomonas sp. N-137]